MKSVLLGVGFALLFVLVPARAHAICDPVACAAMNSNTICNKSTYSCQTIMYAGTICIPSMHTLAPLGTACETDSNACTTDTCGGTASAGDGVCHHNAVANATTCGSNMICTSGTCVCTTGYKVCGAGCIANAMCCTAADCPSDAPNHRVGVCSASGCVFACAAGYKACGGTCIPMAQCCAITANTDCATPPNGCYKTPGTCTAGACSYAYNDGIVCNADADACTPNDKCKSGVCVADAVNVVKCVQRPCHTAPACNHTTGNCDDTALPNTTACGGNGCAAPGTCTAAVCSSPPVDCSAKTVTCKVGICDPAVAGTDKCIGTNVANGLPCSVADKCQLTPACSGGECLGTARVCTPSGTCRVAECNPTTGSCEESFAPAGTPCYGETAACSQNPSCDATGQCVGGAVPDGTPCDRKDCGTATACISGACSCLGDADLGGDPNGAADLSTGGGGGKGCGAVGTPVRVPPLGILLLSLLLLLPTLRRRLRAR